MSIETARPDTVADEVTVLADLATMLRGLLDEYGLDDAEITMDTTFHDDLELESVDLVALSGQLREHYGERVNFATFIAERDLEEIIALTVGELVRYIVTSLRVAGTP
ncbi:acyl carrier protein [Amycolatopsis sp. NPDC058986]|uniref:acyl carrier protein n=1 Tax=unclassified Amycolatopsis TaxID=2618356 RepID=UPI00366C1910